MISPGAHRRIDRRGDLLTGLSNRYGSLQVKNVCVETMALNERVMSERASDLLMTSAAAAIATGQSSRPKFLAARSSPNPARIQIPDTWKLPIPPSLNSSNTKRIELASKQLPIVRPDLT